MKKPPQTNAKNKATITIIKELHRQPDVQNIKHQLSFLHERMKLLSGRKGDNEKNVEKNRMKTSYRTCGDVFLRCA